MIHTKIAQVFLTATPAPGDHLPQELLDIVKGDANKDKSNEGFISSYHKTTSDYPRLVQFPNNDYNNYNYDNTRNKTQLRRKNCSQCFSEVRIIQHLQNQKFCHPFTKSK